MGNLARFRALFREATDNTHLLNFSHARRNILSCRRKTDPSRCARPPGEIEEPGEGVLGPRRAFQVAGPTTVIMKHRPRKTLALESAGIQRKWDS